MDTRNAFRWLALAALLASAPVANAAMYRWVEEDGNITYSNKPPEDPASIRELTTIVTPKAPQPEPPKQVQQQPAAAAPEASARPAIAVTPGAAPGAPGARVTTEAVQDPCLRSSDPKCYERHKDRYHPYLGHAPSAGGAAPRAVGATSTAGAGGSIGMSVPAPIGASVLEPRRSDAKSAR